MPTGGNLPEDILQEILLRLPIKSLGQFKLVSKSWRDIISDPKFAKTRLTINNRCRPKLLLSNGHFFNVFDDDDRPYLSSSNIDFKQTRKWIRVYDSSDGLLLAQAKKYQLFLQNPEVDFDENIAYGLGYDSTSDDYKVVVSIRRVILYLSEKELAIEKTSRSITFYGIVVPTFTFLDSLVSSQQFNCGTTSFLK